MIQPLSPDRTKRPGFAAIISVIIISGIALISSLSIASLYLNESHETTDRSSGVQARSSAFSCANIGVLRLKQDSGYTGNENISVDKVVCSIGGVVVNGSARTVYAQATVNGLTSRIKVEITDVEEFFLTTWSEIPPT